MAEEHKSGPLKQHNKRHKSGRHKSKGEIDVASRGMLSEGGGLRDVQVRNRKGGREGGRQETAWGTFQSGPPQSGETTEGQEEGECSAGKASDRIRRLSSTPGGECVCVFV